MGVLAAGMDAGPLTLERAVFHGREPDENRWDLMDPGPLDSWSTRVRFRPARGWEIQGSFGFLKRPEPLEQQDVRRSTASVSYTREGRGDNYTAVMFAAGRNRRTYSTAEALLGEISHRVGRTTFYGRYEGIELETEHLIFPGTIHAPHPGELIDPLHPSLGMRARCGRRGPGVFRASAPTEDTRQRSGFVSPILPSALAEAGDGPYVEHDDGGRDEPLTVGRHPRINQKAQDPCSP